MWLRRERWPDVERAVRGKAAVARWPRTGRRHAPPREASASPTRPPARSWRVQAAGQALGTQSNTTEIPALRPRCPGQTDKHKHAAGHMLPVPPGPGPAPTTEPPGRQVPQASGGRAENWGAAQRILSFSSGETRGSPRARRPHRWQVPGSWLGGAVPRQSRRLVPKFRLCLPPGGRLRCAGGRGAGRGFARTCRAVRGAVRTRSRRACSARGRRPLHGPGRAWPQPPSVSWGCRVRT